MAPLRREAAASEESAFNSIRDAGETRLKIFWQWQRRNAWHDFSRSMPFVRRQKSTRPSCMQTEKSMTIQCRGKRSAQALVILVLGESN